MLSSGSGERERQRGVGGEIEIRKERMQVWAGMRFRREMGLGALRAVPPLPWERASVVSAVACC